MVLEKKEKKTIVVNPETCIGCGTCEEIAPEYFKVKDDGISYVQKDYDEKDKDIIEEAIDCCPVQAISLK